ncbi:hypothetical protein CGX12_11820 [Zobellella denitrificans]|uniref:hypothetical protein n=1 Tax=Zobellella denitrificans TaxID=347534 RepID=UPI000B8C5F9F|nr:hypothetical protein [Zobellella denitrificans]OXS14901.1 hypothetical protein CGX12_11820 [Zobellella denitrificans]
MTAYRAITQPAGELAINHMRHLLGRCRIASWWSSQPRAVREGICRAAALKPALYWDKPLAQMTDDEREAIRRAVVALKQAMAAMAATDRGEWLHIADFAGVADEAIEEQQEEDRRRELLAQQAQLLRQRAEKVKAAQR